LLTGEAIKKEYLGTILVNRLKPARWSSPTNGGLIDAEGITRQSMALVFVSGVHGGPPS
jgi:hypothetical protein